MRSRREHRPVRLPCRAMITLSCAGLMTAGAATNSGVSAQVDDNARVLAHQLDIVRRDGRVEIAGVTVTFSTGIDRLYSDDARPLWSDPAAVSDLRRAVMGMADDGLRPADYHAHIMSTLEREPSTPLTAALLEIIRTDALIRLTRDLRWGRARSGRPSFVVMPADEPADEPAALRSMIQSGHLLEQVDALRPDHPIHDGLRHALAELRSIEQAGGWGVLGSGPVLRSGSVDQRVPLLRRRLELQGYRVAAASTPGSTMDDMLVDAVRQFQHRHGLNEDGVVGPATLAALNEPVRNRIDQVRVNLERARWVIRDLPDTYLAVNVAGARVYLMQAGRTAFESRAVVGALSTRTPIFRATLTEVVLNPTWTVPRSIAGEILASIRQEGDYLARNGFRIIDQAGSRVDPGRVKFARYSGSTFPYTFVQAAGPTNPLGRIKFVFPNRFSVYLHDTPARSLFDHEERMFSHGCIRVEDPVQLGALILAGQPRWSRKAINDAIDSGRTVNVALTTPLPVLILYWTAATDLHGELHFYEDVYGLDPQILRQLGPG